MANVNYENLNDNSKAFILEKFKEKFSNPNITNLHISSVNNKYHFTFFRVNENAIYFKSVENLLQFAIKLERPFVTSENKYNTINGIRFVYGLPLINVG